VSLGSRQQGKALEWAENGISSKQTIREIYIWKALREKRGGEKEGGTPVAKGSITRGM